jgi:hypothetical protein
MPDAVTALYGVNQHQIANGDRELATLSVVDKVRMERRQEGRKGRRMEDTKPRHDYN